MFLYVSLHPFPPSSPPFKIKTNSVEVINHHYWQWKALRDLPSVTFQQTESLMYREVMLLYFFF